MIETHSDSEFVILVADWIATLLTYDENNQPFKVFLLLNGRDTVLEFGSDCFFEFMQEGVRIESADSVSYFFYDVIEYIEVRKI